MECLSKFFRLDSIEPLVSFFRKLSCFSAARPVEDVSYKIRHNYPRRLVTYDAEELCEPRIIRFSDLTQSARNITYPDCSKGGPEKSSRSHKTDFSKSFEDINKLSPEGKRKLERAGRALYRTHVEQEACSGRLVCHAKWECLTPIQKFRFYWKAMTHHDLQSTPYKNFKEIFIAHHLKRYPCDKVRRTVYLLRKTWRAMSREQRMPFIFHALIYHVSIGEVDPCDKGAVRAFMNRWR